MSHDDRMRVVYPHGGSMVLLRWWTEDDRAHVILARTEAIAHATALRAFEEDAWAEIKDYCEIEIVAPSAQMEEAHAASMLRERVFSFHRELVAYLRDAVEAGHALPPPFAVCAAYEPEDDESEDAETPDEWTINGHYGCRHCVDKVRAAGMTSADVYARWYVAWRAAHPERAHVDPKKVLSRARPAAAGESLWYARAAFGPHASGIELAPWTADDTREDTLFFFRRGRDLDPASLRAILAERQAVKEAHHAMQEATRIAERAREEREQIAATLAFFAQH
jgi:hypothetical protein